MQIVVLCNITNPTLTPLCEDKSTAFAPILEKSLLEFTLDSLFEYGFSEFTVVTDNNPGEILNLCENFENKYNVKVFSSDESVPKILRRAWLGDDILAVECNRNALPDINNFIKDVKLLNSPMAFSVNSSTEFPMLLNSAEMTNFSHNGVYILTKEHLATIPTDTKLSTIEELAEITAAVSMCPDPANIFEIKTPSDLFNANIEILNKLSLTKYKDFQLSDGFFNLSGKPLHGVTIIPPVFVGRNCVIGHGTVLDQGTIISNNATIGEGCYVKNSLVGTGCHIGDKSSLNVTILEKNVEIGKQTVCKNMTILGSNSKVENGTILNNAKVKSGKKISRNLHVIKDVFEQNDGQIAFDDEGKITDFTALLTPKLACEIGLSVGSALDIGDNVCVSFNDHPTSEMLAKALSCGLQSSGINVTNLGDVTMGCLSYGMYLSKSLLGIEINSGTNNYIKIITQDGFKIPSKLELTIETNLNFNNFRYNFNNLGIVYDGNSLSLMYFTFLNKLLPVRFNGMNVKITTSDTAIAKLCDKLFNERNDLNGEILTFHLNKNSFGISAYTEKTGYVFGEKLLLFALKYYTELGENICIEDTFSNVAEQVTADLNGEIFRYSPDFGDFPPKKFVKPLTTFAKDPVLLAVTIVSILQKEETTLEKILTQLPKFYQSKRFVCFDCSENIPLSSEIFNEKTSAYAYLRPSKDKRGITIFANAVNAETATAFCDEIEERLKRHSGK